MLLTTALAITCKYMIYVAPFADVTVTKNDDGSFASTAFIKMSPVDKGHRESLTMDSVAAGESAHLWLSKDTENSIEMIIYSERQPQGMSKLINHHSPIGQEMWGDCEQAPTVRQSARSPQPSAPGPLCVQRAIDAGLAELVDVCGSPIFGSRFDEFYLASAEGAGRAPRYSPVKNCGFDSPEALQYLKYRYKPLRNGDCQIKSIELVSDVTLF